MGYHRLFLNKKPGETRTGTAPVNNRKHLLLPAVLRTIGNLFIDTTRHNMVDYHGNSTIISP